MIYLSDKAIARIKKQLQKRKTGIGIIIEVRNSGCSGYSYHLDFVDQLSPQQRVFNYDDFVVVIAEKDLKLLDGLHLDVDKKGLNEFFSFNNPQATTICGCGTSFAVDK